MKEALLYKILKDGNYFKKGQKVWTSNDFGIHTGAAACEAIGRFKCKGKWTLGWIHMEWEKGKCLLTGNPDAKFIGVVEVSDKFYLKLKEEAYHIERRRSRNNYKNRTNQRRSKRYQMFRSGSPTV